jgi:FkbM family methyltransferase
MPTNKILDLYRELAVRQDNGERFIKDIFLDDEYGMAAPQLTVVDVGAYAGEFSFYCLPFSKEIYAIEPDPVPYEKLEAAISRYELEPIIRPFKIAIGGRDGERSMHMSHFGGSAFSQVEEDKVTCKTLATFFKENEIEHVDILKIDIESAEYEVFSSLDFPEIAPSIDFIIGEAHAGIDGLIKSLEPLGFEVKNTLVGSDFIARRIK